MAPKENVCEYVAQVVMAALCNRGGPLYFCPVIGSRPSDHYFRSACLFVCMSVCLCRVFLSRLRSDLDQTRIHVTCSGLVVSPRI